MTLKRDPRVSKKDLRTVIALYRKGATLRSLAMRYRCEPSTIAHHLKANGVVRRRPGRPETLSKGQAQWVVHLYEKGLSSVQVGKQFGCSYDTVLNTLRRRGLRPRSRAESIRLRNKGRPRNKERTEFIRRQLAQGISAPAIARRLGISHQAVYAHIKRHGFKEEGQHPPGGAEN